MVQGVLIEDGFIVNTNPATGEVISRVPVTADDQVNDMVQKANAALPSWSTCDAKTRIDLLRNGLKALGQRSDEIATLIVQEMGKPLREAQEEMAGAVRKDEYMTILQAAQEPVTHGTSVVVRQALGVVVVLSPWNFPVDEILLLALPALAAGNTVIVKPSEVTPECGAAVVSSLASALPSPDIIQLAQGEGTVGSRLVCHPHIHMVAMTGSSATGRHILSNAAPNLKRVVCELGGKDPMVVFDDADILMAARDAVAYSICNAGQVCCSVERIYVAESIKDDFEKKVVECVARDCRVGNGMDPGVTVGPMVSRLQRDHVARQVDSALEQGAKLLFRANVPENNDKASFYPVSVLSDITGDMDIFRSETFGPIVAISTFDGSEGEAIRLANDTEYGLSGSVYSQDLSKAKRVASSVHCGQVGINCWALEKMNVACPWVGHKNSGFGYHSGIEGFHQFSIPKTLVFHS